MTRFLMLNAAALATIAGFIWLYHDELVKAVSNIQTGKYFGNEFGAADVPHGLGTVMYAGLAAFGLHGNFIDGLPQNAGFSTVIALLLAAATVITAIRFSGAPGLRSALAPMPRRHANYLVIGATLICGCFFTAHNVGYRGIFLLYAVPGVLLLAGREIFTTVPRWTVGAIIFNMWYPPLDHAFDYLRRQDSHNIWGMLPRYVAWLAHELSWWWVATMFLAVLIRFALESTVWQTLWHVGSRRRAVP
jgi:hypothetical protein